MVQSKTTDVKCKTCGFVAFGGDPNRAGKEKCLSCGNIRGVEPLNSLVDCEGCGRKISNNALKCPKCGWIRTSVCQVCSKGIPLDSPSCPECGDPKPFAIKEDGVIVFDGRKKKKVIEGRASRGEFFKIFILLILASIVMAVVPIFEVLPEVFLYTLLVVFIIVGNYFSITTGIRRLHDFNKSGWWFLFMFVPIANIALLISLLFTAGTKGENRFGVEKLKI